MQESEQWELHTLPAGLCMSSGQGSGPCILASTDKAQGLLGLCTQRRASNWTQAPITPMNFESLQVLQGQAGDAFAAELGQWPEAFR